MKLLPNYMSLLAGGLVLSLLITGAGCKKQLDINQNPNYPSYSQGSPSVVFPVATLATTAYVGGEIALVGGMWSQYFTQSNYANQYTDIDSYNMPNTDGFVDGPWDGLFPQALTNYQYVIQNADSTGDWTYYLLAQVMKAYTTEVMVDLWDQIPYAQSLGGLANLNPTFDSGYAVYRALIDSINIAIGKDFTAITNSQPTAEQDPVFAGKVSNWIAFANTLKLKMYLRMVNAQPAAAQQGVTSLINSGVSFLSIDAAFTNFTNNPGLENPMYEQNIRELNTNSNLKASTTLVSWFDANNDSRIVYWYGATNPASINQGDFRGGDPNYGNAPIFYETATDPVEFISAAESYFLQAEADVRYFGGTKAPNLYNLGVTAAFAAVGQDASSYIAPGGAYAWGNEVEGGQTLTPLQQIIRQKWASCMYGCHGIEAYFDQNRTGFPLQSPVYSTDPTYVPGQIVVVKNSVLPSGDLPRRLPFPYDETSRNTNAPAPVAITTPVWWGIQ